MHDFSCTDPDEMNSSVLAERARYLKKDDKGVQQMSIVMEELLEEIGKEERQAKAEEIAKNLLEEGTLPIPTIARVSDLTEERVRELAEQREETVFA